MLQSKKIKIRKTRRLQSRRKFCMTSGVIRLSLSAKCVHYHSERRTISSSSQFICIIRPSSRDAMPVSFAVSTATARTWRLFGIRMIGRFDSTRRIHATKTSREMQQVVLALRSRNWAMLENTSACLETKTPSKRWRRNAISSWCLKSRSSRNSREWFLQHLSGNCNVSQTFYYLKTERSHYAT